VQPAPEETIGSAFMGTGMNAERARRFQELTDALNPNMVAWEGGHPLWRGETTCARSCRRFSATHGISTCERGVCRATVVHRKWLPKPMSKEGTMLDHIILTVSDVERSLDAADVFDPDGYSFKVARLS
jgi:hypothetical protein